jgi:hypothetical protein
MQEDSFGCLRISSISSTGKGRSTELRLNFWYGQNTYLFSKISSLALGPTQPQTQQLQGILSQSLKWPGCVSDQSPPFAADVTDKHNYTSTPPFAFMECLGPLLPVGHGISYQYEQYVTTVTSLGSVFISTT